MSATGENETTRFFFWVLFVCVIVLFVDRQNKNKNRPTLHTNENDREEGSAHGEGLAGDGLRSNHGNRRMPEHVGAGEGDE